MTTDLRNLVTVGARAGVRDQWVFGLEALDLELESRGADVSKLFAGTPLTRADLRNPAARLSRADRLHIYANAHRLCPAPDLAMRAGMRQHLGSYGMYGFGLSTHATLRDALDFGLRHLRLLGPVMSVGLRDEGRTLVLRSEDTEEITPMLPFVIELWRSSFLTLMKSASGHALRSRRMRFAYEAPVNVDAYAAFFDCPLEFGARQTEWHLDVSALDVPCAHASPLAAQLCESWCEASSPSPSSARETSFRERVSAVCFDDPKRIPTADEVATQLHVSRRTFHRRLASEKTSYQELVDDARRQRVLSLLTDPGLTLDHVGAAVGFTEATNFSKAFRRWTGMTPSAYRAQRAGA